MDRNWYMRAAVMVGSGIFAALSLWPSLETWIPVPAIVSDNVSGRISPGLDIKGGLRLMYEVEVDEYIRDRRDRLAEQVQRQCGELIGVLGEGEADKATRESVSKIQARCNVERVDKNGGAIRAIRLTFTNEEDAAKLTKKWVKERFSDLHVASGAGEFVVELEMRPDQLQTLRTTAVGQAVRTIGDRIDSLGLREASVIGRETDIIVEVPGADQKSFERIKSIISRTARLEFKIVDDGATGIAEILGTPPEGITMGSDGQPFLMAEGENARQTLVDYIATLTVPGDHTLVVGRTEANTEGAEAWRSYYLFDIAEATGEDLDEATVGYDPQTGNPEVDFGMNTRGAARMSELTSQNIGKRMAIVLDDRAESAPVIQGEIGARGRITLGAYMDRAALLQEANDLAVVLQAGALPAPLRPSNEQLIGPTLGRDSVYLGAKAAAIGIGLVLLFMLAYYQIGGLVADLMVALNLLLLMGLMAALEATLTLPGIAALALTVGMAVDANVLISERIREEIRAGRTPRAAVELGFGRAYASVFDSQITTAIAGVVLWQFGTGPIKGFATMLLIGIATSLFTGTFCSKVLLDLLVRGSNTKKLRMG